MIADIANYISTHSAQLATQSTAHIGISLFALIVATAIGVPCGYLASKSSRSAPSSVHCTTLLTSRVSWP